MSLRKGHSHQQMRKHQIGFEQPCCSECCKISPFSDKTLACPLAIENAMIVHAHVAE